MEKVVIKRNGHLIEFEPILRDCTYHYPKPGQKCVNCNGTKKYVDGYYMTYSLNGQKIGFVVDNIK